MQPCELYYNQHPAEQHLFAAAAALFALTGNSAFRDDADAWWVPFLSLIHI